MELKIYTLVNIGTTLESFIEGIDSYSGIDILSLDDATGIAKINTGVEVVEITLKKI